MTTINKKGEYAEIYADSTQNKIRYHSLPFNCVCLMIVSRINTQNYIVRVAAN